MSDTNSTLNLPNYDTPLAFLPPIVAYQTSVSIYVVVASVGILVWDILDNVSDEFQLLFRHSISLNTIAYFGSRIGALGYSIGSVVFETAPIGGCAAGETISDIFYPISFSCSSLLFFFRVRAVYNESRRITIIFLILWLVVLGCTTLVPITLRGEHIGQTAYCQDADIPRLAYVAILVPLAYDTLIFIAISWRIAGHSYMALNLRHGFKIVVLGHYLPKFTRAVLLDNQKYYFVILVSNIVMAVLAFNASIPTPMRSMASIPNMVLTNIMACRVYRKTRSPAMQLLDDATRDPRGRPMSPVAFGHMPFDPLDEADSHSHQLDVMLPPGPAYLQRDTKSSIDIPEGR